MTGSPEIVGADKPRPAAASADLPVLVHVGLHKTGTTWLQKRVFGPRDDGEIAYCEDRRIMRGNFVTPPAGEFSAERAREEFGPVLERARGAGLPLVLQDEMMAALPFHSRFVREVAADRLAETFPDAKILVTVREQVSVIASTYGHYIRAGHTASLDDFLAQPDAAQARFWNPILNLAHFDYERLLETYESRFGRGNVVLAPMEWMLAEPDAFVARLAETTGVALSSVAEGETGKVVNPAFSELGYAIARQINRLVTQDARWRGKRGRIRLIQPMRIAYWTTRITPAPIRRRMKKRATEAIRATVGDRYRESNARVAERIGVDLARYGYAT